MWPGEMAVDDGVPWWMEVSKVKEGEMNICEYYGGVGDNDHVELIIANSHGRSDSVLGKIG